MKLLLHTCCGPCFLGVWEELGSKKHKVTNYFYNPNIYPKEEYTRRLEGLKIAVASKTMGIVEAEYDPKSHAEVILGHEDKFPGRCLLCYRLRLEMAAAYAKEHDFDAFSTTLLVSPYQQHDELKRIGEEIAAIYGVDFYYTDWRPYFRKGQVKAKFIPIYRQKYCGCKHSLQPKK